MGPIAPPWFVLPLSFGAMIAVAGYILALRDAPDDAMPSSRRNIRHVTSVVILVTIPVLAYSFGVASPAQGRGFVLGWTASVWLLVVVLLLACIDLLDGVRLTRRLRRQRRELLIAAQHAIAAAIAQSGTQSPASSARPSAAAADEDRPRA